MSGYYEEKLSASALERVYELAPPRVQQYLRSEVGFVVSRLRPTDVMLDLGCGYGRTLPDFAGAAAFAVGIDSSRASLRLAQARICGVGNCLLVSADAVAMPFGDDSFDTVACIQNGISAFHVDGRALVSEALRVTRPGGSALFSSYSPQFWDDRLAWFEAQSEAALLGPIDYAKTGDGVIVCTDGFTAATVEGEEFRALANSSVDSMEIVEVDESSLFCVMHKSAVGSLPIAPAMQKDR